MTMQREVYFAQRGDVIKIGVSTNVPARLEQLRQGSGAPLSLLGSIAGGYDVERALHQKLRAHRVYREWYRDHPEVRAAIQNSLNNFSVTNPIERKRQNSEKFKAVCKILWPVCTAEKLAEIGNTNERTGTRWLCGHSTPPAVVFAAILIELTKLTAS